jgi:Caspase domain/TIR domain
MIESLIAALGGELGLTSKEIADVVWLALQMNNVNWSAEAIDQSAAQPEKVSQTPNPTHLSSDDYDSPAQRKRKNESEPEVELYPPGFGQSAGMVGALALKVPDARSLREPLALARALKPLLRKVMTGYSMVLDEAATVGRIADEGVWLPVLKPSLEPWLELALVVDEGVSMQIWRRTIVELQRFMEHYGVFRDVRVWGLLTDDLGQVQIRPGIGRSAKRQGLRRPSALIDPSGRRLVLVVTDCVADLWRDGTVQPALKLWAASGPMAIVQMLPEWLWARTGLGFASAVRLQGLAAGLANQQLRVRNLSAWDEVDLATGIRVPVVTLEPERLEVWAQMVAGKGGAWSAGVVFDAVGGGASLPVVQDGEWDGAQRLQRFRVTASPMARRLAGLLAAAPVISLPVVRIIQERLLAESRQVHVAEVFLGGLLKPLVEITAQVNVDAVQYEFLDGVRDALLESVRTSETVNVLNEVSQFVAERLGLSIDAFMAVLRSPQQIEDQELVGTAHPFAIVTAQVLRQLGSEYMPFAEELEEQFRQTDLYSSSQTALANSDHVLAKRVALLIGVSEYGEGLSTLLTPQNDILAMQRVLQNPDIGGFDEVEVLANPNLFQMDDAIGKLFSEQRNPDDLILLYFSGHGLKDNQGEFHFALPASRFDQGELVKGTTLPASALHHCMNQSASKRQIVILDCCFSGAVGNYVSRERSIAPSTKNSSTEEEVGHVLMTSTGSIEYNFEHGDGQELSLYTKYLVEGLETGAANIDGNLKITIDELHEYLKRKIASNHPELKTAPKLFVLKDKGYQLKIANCSATDANKQSDVLKFFISYASQDKALANELHLGIQSMGHSTFTGEDMILGEDWASRIDAELAACDYLLLLISEGTTERSFAAQEFRQAKQLYDQTGKPRILPIRVNFPINFPLSNDLQKHLQQINSIEWSAPNDTSKILRHIAHLINDPHSLSANRNKFYAMSQIFSQGYLISPEEAQLLIDKNSKNRDVLSPYLNAVDLNSHPEQLPSRWIVDFKDWALDDNHDTSTSQRDKPCAIDYPDCLGILYEKVKPDVDRSQRKSTQEKWWLCRRPQKDFEGVIVRSEKVLASARVSKFNLFEFVPSNTVFSHHIIIFAIDQFYEFSVLQSSFHECWVKTYASNLQENIRYSPLISGTFPFPESRSPSLNSMGERYHKHRRGVMQVNQEGLTKTYDRFHNPQDHNKKIVRLRQLHIEMDSAIASAYGWKDLNLDHDFRTNQESTRFTLSEECLREIHRRLLILNRQRYTEQGTASEPS